MALRVTRFCSWCYHAFTHGISPYPPSPSIYTHTKPYIDCSILSRGPETTNPPQDSIVSLPLRNILMLLRKCCNHPYLLEYPLDPATQQFKIDEELVSCSGKMKILDQLLKGLRSRGHKVSFDIEALLNKLLLNCLGLSGPRLGQHGLSLRQTNNTQGLKISE